MDSPRIEQEFWLDGQGHQILNFEKTNKEENFALVVLKYPWTTISLASIDEPRLLKNNFELVSLSERRKFVKSKLVRRSSRENYINYCSHHEEKSEAIEMGDMGLLYVCFWGAEYIAWLWRGADPQLTNKTQPFQEIALEQIRYLRGVYQCELDLDVESHSFVLDIIQDQITVYNSYGGTPEFFIASFDRDWWIETFLKMNNLEPVDQREIYHELWGFRPEMITAALGKIPQKVILSELKVAKIY